MFLFYCIKPNGEALKTCHMIIIEQPHFFLHLSPVLMLFSQLHIVLLCCRAEKNEKNITDALLSEFFCKQSLIFSSLKTEKKY